MHGCGHTRLVAVRGSAGRVAAGTSRRQVQELGHRGAQQLGLARRWLRAEHGLEGHGEAAAAAQDELLLGTLQAAQQAPEPGHGDGPKAGAQLLLPQQHLAHHLPAGRDEADAADVLQRQHRAHEVAAHGSHSRRRQQPSLLRDVSREHLVV